MARQTLVVDASVGVKWFSDKGEASLASALAIRDGHVAGITQIVVPDLFHYEVANALVHKRHIPTEEVQRAIQNLFGLGLEVFTIDAELMVEAVKRAREFKITIYDASYIAVAEKCNCPLVTANPRHQGLAVGCQVIPLEQWWKGN